MNGRTTHVVSDENGDDVTLTHGVEYRIRTPHLDLVGIWDAERSGINRLYFHTEDLTGWFRVRPEDVRDVEPSGDPAPLGPG